MALLTEKSDKKGLKPLSVINYEKLAVLLGHPNAPFFRKISAATLADGEEKTSKALVEVGHDDFMKQYKTIFLSDFEKRERQRRIKMDKFHRNAKNSTELLPAIHSANSKIKSDAVSEIGSFTANATAPLVRQGERASKDDCMVHDTLEKQNNNQERNNIETYVRNIRPPKYEQQGRPIMVLSKKQCNKLAKHLAKRPYERGHDENIKIFNILQNYEPVCRQLPLHDLKELIITATLERYDDNGVVVFAGSGFHVVLQGSVKPLSNPYIEYLDELEEESAEEAPGRESSSLKASADQVNYSKENTMSLPNSSKAQQPQSGAQSHEGRDSNLFTELLGQDATTTTMSASSSIQPHQPTADGTSEGSTLVPYQTPSRSSDFPRRVSFADKPKTPEVAPDERPNSTDQLEEQLKFVRQLTLESLNASRLEVPDITLKSGESFGTFRLQSVNDSLDGNAMLCRVTEPKTVLLKLSAASYERIHKALTQRQLDKKVNLIASCGGYRYWSRISLEHLAKCAGWLQFAPGTVLAAEGEVCPYAGYLLAGQCRIARRIIVREKVSSTREIKRRKEVIMGEFGPGSSFGERSLMANEPMKFTLITVTTCEFAIVNMELKSELDPSVCQLLAQVDATGPSLEAAAYADDEIYQEYIKQENDRQWSEYKRHVVNEVINYQGIMPGFGKWSKSFKSN